MGQHHWCFQFFGRPNDNIILFRITAAMYERAISPIRTEIPRLPSFGLNPFIISQIPR